MKNRLNHYSLETSQNERFSPLESINDLNKLQKIAKITMIVMLPVSLNAFSLTTHIYTFVLLTIRMNLNRGGREVKIRIDSW